MNYKQPRNCIGFKGPQGKKIKYAKTSNEQLFNYINDYKHEESKFEKSKEEKESLLESDFINDKSKCLKKVFEICQRQQWTYIALKDIAGQLTKILEENKANKFKDISLKYAGDIAAADFCINETFKSIEKNYDELYSLFSDLLDEASSKRK